MPISELRDRARSELLDFSWRQWTQLGVGGHPTGRDSWVMDPEALVLFTTQVAQRDPRLFDEVLDWLRVNQRLLILQRLRNLTARFPIDPNLVEACVEWAARAEPSGPWRSVKPRPATTRPPVPLFAPEVVSFVSEPDPVFEERGYLRPRVHSSRKSARPDVLMSVNLAFRIRLLFGAGSRAEVVRILFTTQERSLDTASISDETAFAKRNLHEVLSTLAEAGLAQSHWVGNERAFSMSRDAWGLLATMWGVTVVAPFISWTHLLPALSRVLSWLEEESEQNHSTYMTSSRARDLVEEIRPDLVAVGLSPPDRPGPRASYLPMFENIVGALLMILQPAGSRAPMTQRR